MQSTIHSQETKEIKIDVSFLQAPKPTASNYIETAQNTPEWLEIRKFRITGSRVPVLLGLKGKKKFDSYWDIVKNGKI